MSAKSKKSVVKSAKPTPKKAASSLSDEQHEALVAKELARVGINARRRAHYHQADIVFIEDGIIYRKTAKGKLVKVGRKLKSASKTISAKALKIK